MYSYSYRKHLRAVFNRWGLLMGSIWSLLSSADLLVSKYTSADFQKAWAASWYSPKWGWETWIIGLLIIGFVSEFFYSYRKIKEPMDKLDALERSAPRIEIIPGTFRCDERNLSGEDEARNTIRVPIRSLVVQFRNQPKIHAQTAVARDVIATAKFYNIDAGGQPRLILEDYPRWATNDNPESKEANKHFVPTDIKIGGMAELDLAVKYLHEPEAYAVTHQSYLCHALKHPQPLEGNKFLLVITLSAVNVKECFEFKFENPGKDKPLLPISMRQTPTVGP